MNLLIRVKTLCSKQNISISRLEQDTGLANGSVRKWEKTLPSSDRLEKVANYFSVSTDYLLGRTIKSIIDDRIFEKETSVEIVAKNTGVPLHWLQNIDSFIPGAFGYDHEIGYEWLLRIEKELDLPDKTLQNELKKHEIPPYEGSSISAKEDFKEPYKSIMSSDPDIRRIERARNNMTEQDKKRMMKILEASFDEAFDDEE